MKVFFTYVWGPPGNPAWPLTFASKSSRTLARKSLSEGDVVFTVGTMREPTSDDARGRVLGMYRVSDLEVNTADYALEKKAHHSGEYDSVKRFPFALHPLEVFQITGAENLFAHIAGPLTSTHHLQAQSTVVEVEPDLARCLLALPRTAVPIAPPRTEFGLGRIAKKNSKLAPKHEGSFSGTFSDHAIWYVYALVLQDRADKPLAVKIGYSHDPAKRAASLNEAMASEVTGLSWSVFSAQPVASEDAARAIEQSVLHHFEADRLDSNGEMLKISDPTSVMTRIALEMRSKLAA
jgi:T5orf172 domain